MPRRAIPHSADAPGYGLADVLVLTDATRAMVAHWADLGVVKADLEDTAGSGYHRRFSTLNLIEVQLGSVINRFRVPTDVIRGAVWAFRRFHENAVALYEDSTDAPIVHDVAHRGLFTTREHRKACATRFVLEEQYGGESIEAAERRAGEMARVWAQIRSGPFGRGVPDPSWARFLGLFLHLDDSPSAVVALDPPLAHGPIEGSAIVIDLANIVFRVGQHCARVGMALSDW
jgi:hypothetical protein